MKANRLLIRLVILAAVLLSACGSQLRVGALQSESQSVKLEDTGPVRVNIEFGAGDLRVRGGAEQLLEAGFTYNVAVLKPQIEYAGGALAVRQPGASGFSSLQNIGAFRNEWDLRLQNDVPMDLSVNVGGGGSSLEVADLSLTGLDVTLGAGTSTLDLNGNWADDLNATVDAGATDLTILLPKDVGVRIEVDRGPTIIDAPGLKKNGDVYTNDAYGVSDVTLRIKISTGIGVLNLEVEA